MKSFSIFIGLLLNLIFSLPIDELAARDTYWMAMATADHKLAVNKAKLDQIYVEWTRSGTHDPKSIFVSMY